MFDILVKCVRCNFDITGHYEESGKMEETEETEM